MTHFDENGQNTKGIITNWEQLDNDRWLAFTRTEQDECYYFMFSIQDLERGALGSGGKSFTDNMGHVQLGPSMLHLSRGQPYDHSTQNRLSLNTRCRNHDLICFCPKWKAGPNRLPSPCYSGHRPAKVFLSTTTGSYAEESMDGNLMRATAFRNRTCLEYRWRRFVHGRDCEGQEGQERTVEVTE